jgi:predicted RNA-binding Zn ribbon-like protein
VSLSYTWLGAPLALDLANTVVVVRPGEEIDGLADDAELARWLELERGRLGDVDGAESAVAEFHALRRSVRALVHAAAHGRELPAGAVEAVNRTTAAAATFPQLRGDAAVVESRARTRGDEILGAIAASAVRLVGGPDRGRLRNCEAPRCGMYFLAGREGQVWCCAACGNRARVARHAQRAARTATPPAPAA